MPVLIYLVICTLIFVVTLATIKSEDGYVDVAGLLISLISYIPILNLYVVYAVIASFFSRVFEGKIKFLEKKLF